MAKHIPFPFSMAFTLALVVSTACIPVSANAHQASEQHQQQESSSATTGKDEQPARGRLADAKADLKLSTEQEKLWGPVEDAMRNLQEQRRTLRSSSDDDQATDQIEQLRRAAEQSTQRADALKQLAEAVQPLWATLSDEQKRELPRIVGVAMGQDHQDRMGRGRNAHDDRGMDRRRQGESRRDRDDDGYANENGRSGSDDGQGYGRDDNQRADRTDNQRSDRTDGSSRRGSQDDYRHGDQHRSREWNRDRRDYDRRSERHRGCCCRD